MQRMFCRLSRSLWVVWITVVFFSVGPVQAQNPPDASGGPTFQISETPQSVSSYDDQGPKLATDAVGNFVVVWGTTTRGEYTYGYGYQYDANVLSRRFDAGTTAQGGEVTVATSGTAQLLNPTTTMDSDGDFVVVWQSSFGSYYSYGIDVIGQRYDQNGGAVGSEFPVDTGGGLQRNPNVAMSPGGEFAVVWEGVFNQLNDFDAFVQRYDSSGVAQGLNSSVSSDLGNLNGLRDNPAIGMDAAGNFVVVWHKQDYGNYTEKTILGRRFGSDGMAVADEFEVGTATTTFSSQFTNALEVASDSAGNFIVVWEDYDAGAFVTRIMARLFDDMGAAQGNAFQVNTAKDSYGYPIHEKRPDVTWDTAGGFVIVWDTDYEVFGRRYEPDATPSTEFRVDEPMSPYFQGAKKAAVAPRPNGEFVVAWQGPVGPYGYDYVMGRTIDALPEPSGGLGAAILLLLLLANRSDLRVGSQNRSAPE
jgi:hypothetical protein